MHYILHWENAVLKDFWVMHINKTIWNTVKQYSGKIRLRDLFTYTLRKKGSSMVLQNGQKFYLEPFAIWTRLKDLQTILSCVEPLKVLHFPVKNL